MSRPLTFGDRLLAETVRAYELDGASPADDPAAEAAGRDAGGGLEARIAARAAAHPVAGRLCQALHQLRVILLWLVLLGAVAGLAGGAATARATLAADPLANIYRVLGGVLGVQTLALLLWLAMLPVMAYARAGAAVSLGGLALGAGQWILRRVHPDPAGTAAVEAAGRVYGAGRVGRWLLGSISHGIWLAFNVGCLVTILLLLSTRQYTFVWETTILGERQYVQLTRALGGVPGAVGFPVPTDAEIAASRWTGAPIDQPAGVREAWSGLLVGALVTYGLLPRLLLLALCLTRRRSAAREYRLDTSLPGFARLEPRLTARPRLEAPARTGEDLPPLAELDRVGVPPGSRPPGPPAALGIELDRPASGWPPPVQGVAWTDLGLLDNRDDQRAALGRLEEAAHEPAALLVACDLANTPDRGTGRLLARLRARVARPPLVVLTGGQTLRERGYDASRLASRIEDWRRLAREAGVPDARVIEVDLDRLTDVSLARLSAHLQDGAAAESGAPRRIEQAFGLIADHAARWSGAPGIRAQAALQRAIADLYGSGPAAWTRLLNATGEVDLASGGARLTDRLRGSADRMIHLLPDRLRRSPKWLAAGALTGALGCVVASVTLTPAAIVALPTWSAIGAAIGAALQPLRPGTAEPAAPPIDLGDAVRAAALFAMTLELQGRDEAAITRMLDRAIGPDPDAELPDAAAARAWLDGLRHRFDLALAERA